MIYVIAYFANNLGDDLFVRELVRRYPFEEFYLCADSPSFLQCFSSEKNVHIVQGIEYTYIRMRNKLLGYKGSFRNHKMMQKAKATVRIGGSVFIESEGWQKKFHFNEGKRLFIIGANFGPYSSEEYINAVSKKIGMTVDCCFRDRYSYDMFKDIRQTRYAPDILFGYEAAFDEAACDDSIGISVIDCKNRKQLSAFWETYESGIKKICSYYLSQNRTVKLFSFCDAEGDAAAIHRIVNSIEDSSGIEIVSYKGDIDCFLGELMKCSVLFATRFHAMILGWKFRKTVIPIVYSQKQLHVMQDLKFNGWYWNIGSGEALSDDWMNQISRKNIDFLDDAVLHSKDHFLKLDEFLKGKEGS